MRLAKSTIHALTEQFRRSSGSWDDSKAEKKNQVFLGKLHDEGRHGKRETEI
jgi:hypothetical protein